MTKNSDPLAIPQMIVFQVDCLSLLERLPNQCGRLIYLDPPWHTANGFTFSPSEGGTATPASSKALPKEADFMAHLDWLGRLVQQSFRVTTHDGNIVIHVEPRIEGYLRLIIAELLSSAEVVRIPLAAPPVSLRVGLPIDNQVSLLLVRKSHDSVWNMPTRPMTEREVSQRYGRKDSDGRQYSLADLTAPAPSGHGPGWNGLKPPPGRRWRFSKERLEAMRREGRIFEAPGSGMPRLKVYADEQADIHIGMDWSDIPTLVPIHERIGVAGQQSLALLDRLVKATTVVGDLVIDPMCGAGTALLACEMLGRRWIGADADAETAAVAKSRIEAFVETPFGPDVDISRLPVVCETASLPRSTICSGQPHRFVLNKPVPLEETRHYEFKEVKGDNTVRAITNTADEYAVAFLNSEGGRILWGVRNEDRFAVGVHLKYRERDDVARLVDNKLCAIQPSLPPSSWRLDFFPVYDHDSAIEDLWIIQLVVPRPSGGKVLYGTGSGVVYVKTSSGKKKLSFAELQAEVVRRHSGNGD